MANARLQGPAADPPILCYHKIDTRLELGFTRLGPRAFRRQMEALARGGWTSAGSADLARAAAAGTAAPRRVGITFDDGYDALDRHAFPVLAGLGFTCVVFVITDWVGRENGWDVQYGWRRFRHLDWDRLGYWQERGVVEVQSHGTSHARLTWLPDDAVAEEFGRSKEEIGRRLGRVPTAVSYPFGATDRRIRGLAAQAGYAAGFAGPNDVVAGDPLMLPRLPVYWWDPFTPPLVMRDSAAGSFARAVARTTNRVAVGTALIQRASGRRYVAPRS